ncbi:MAG: HesA/MoeB/ThiF family protein, partial [Bacteroidota bacterium]
QIASHKISNINPNIRTKTYNYHVNAGNVEELIKEFDIVVDGSDNFETKYLLNDECAVQNKPLVYAAIEKYEGQVSVFNARENCPTYRCVFPLPPSKNERTDCDRIGVSPFLPQIIGGLQAAEVIKLITGIGEPLCGKLLLFDALKTKFSIFSFDLDPQNKIKKKLT